MSQMINDVKDPRVTTIRLVIQREKLKHIDLLCDLGYFRDRVDVFRYALNLLFDEREFSYLKNNLNRSLKFLKGKKRKFENKLKA